MYIVYVYKWWYRWLSSLLYSKMRIDHGAFAKNGKTERERGGANSYLKRHYGVNCTLRFTSITSLYRLFVNDIYIEVTKCHISMYIYICLDCHRARRSWHWSHTGTRKYRYVPIGWDMIRMYSRPNNKCRSHWHNQYSSWKVRSHWNTISMEWYPSIVDYCSTTSNPAASDLPMWMEWYRSIDYQTKPSS